MTRRPAGGTSVLGAALVIVLGKAGVDLTVDEGVTLVAAATLVVSWFTPREKRASSTS